MDQAVRKGLRSARIAAVFGLVFVEVNAGELHPQSLVTAVRTAAAVVFIAVFIRLLGLKDHGVHVGQGARPHERFGAGYWTVAILEIAALAVGLLVLHGSIAVHSSVVHELRQHATSAERAWVAFVVGVHFFGLMLVWRRASAGLLGVLIALCGAVALQLARHADHTAASAVFAGIIPGALLLFTSAVRAARRNRQVAVAVAA